jgi:hypothetical protein
VSEAAQNSVEQQVERPAYVAPPATLPMPAFVLAHLTPEPEPKPDVTTTPLAAAPPPASPSLVLSVPPPPVPEPAPTAPKAVARRLVGLVAVVLVLLIGLGVGVSLGRNSNDRPNAVATQGPAINAGATQATQLTTPPPTIATTVAAPSPTTSTPGRPVIPEHALALTEQEALDELNREVTDDASQVADLAGAWLPQVSSKCVGISVDIGPNWIPDGVDDTVHVTLQQILAYHIGLHNRFNAVLLLPTQAGLLRDQASVGPCAGSTTWMSAVPIRFASAADANAWCAANVPPVRECDARYFAGPGERSTMVLRY